MLEGRTILVIGSGGTLGSALAAEVEQVGGCAVRADVQPQDETWLSLDITEPASVMAAVAALEQRPGGLDGVVNCAYPRSPNYGRALFQVAYEDFCLHQAMHLGGAFLIAQKFSELFQRQGRGCVINLASIYGVVAPRFGLYEGTDMTMPVEYAAAKAGIVHLTRYFATSLAGSGVRVNCVSFGGIRAGQPERFLTRYRAECLNKGMLDAADVIGTILFLLSDRAQMINGQNIIVDDGFTL
ncbi:MAG: oxidoreductase [Rhodothalassiaceae bacterium]